MQLSDSMTAGYPDIWCSDVWAAWSLVATQAAVDAASRADPAQIRSLRVLFAELAGQEDARDWESLLAAIYVGIAEASGNRAYEALVYELWQVLIAAGPSWDVAARLWPVRGWAEVSLGEVIAGLVDADPGPVRRAMERHLGGAVDALDR